MASKLKLSNANGKTLVVENSDVALQGKTVACLSTVVEATSYVGSYGDVVHVSDKHLKENK